MNTEYTKTNNITCTVYGERNSGTNFLSKLLQMNGVDVFCGAEHKKLIFAWKHGYPEDYLKLINERVVNIFIIRSLDEWLISMFHNPHTITISNDLSFEDFLTFENIPLGYAYKHRGFYLQNGKLQNVSDFRKDVFEIRYEKIKSYIEFNHKYKDVVFVKLDYIRNKENCRTFLEQLNIKYDLGMSDIIPEILINLKTGEPGKKREYDTVIDEKTREIINRLKNDKVEEWVDKLTFQMS